MVLGNMIIPSTEHFLIPCIRDLSNDSGKGVKAFVNREILARIVSLAIPLFRAFDTLLNLGLALGRLGGRFLRGCGIKVIHAKTVSFEKILCNLQCAKEGIIKEPGLLFRLFCNPKQAGASVAKNNDALPRIFHQKLAQQQLNTMPPDQLDNNWNINDFLGHVYVINLKKDTERLKSIRSNFDKIGGCNFERFEATNGIELSENVWNRVDDNSWGLPEGEKLNRQHMRQAGVFMSHYSVIKNANEKYLLAQKQLQESQASLTTAKTDQEIDVAKKNIEVAENQVREYSRILILEDDTGFGFVDKTHANKPAVVNMKGAGVEFRKVMKELPENWDMLYLNAVDRFKWMKYIFPSHSERLNRLNAGLLANAIAINSKAYPTILNALSKIDNPKLFFKPVDHEYGYLNSLLVAITPKKPLAYQMAGCSTITDGEGFEPWNGSWSPNRGF